MPIIFMPNNNNYTSILSSVISLYFLYQLGGVKINKIGFITISFFLVICMFGHMFDLYVWS